MRERVFVKSLREYERGRRCYHGHVVLIRCTNRGDWPSHRFDPDLGWLGRVSGRLEIHDSPGDHLGMLRAPNADKIAAILRPRLVGRP
jgi:thioesterase domain-containing protein